ncbi:MAG TPA: 50S ribosomal protein L27 [Candidatus Saccharimonadales bacterium]|nr:50S ribosomal protein L27 [Candidatus Saccharimonadales bacterium]
MASTKAKGSSKNGRDSQSKRLGVKVYGGENVKRGGIIIRQRGSKFYVGQNVSLAGDDTIFATKDGVVTFQRRAVKSHSGHHGTKTFVSVAPAVKQ